MPWWACNKCTESNSENIVCLDYNHSLLEDVPNEVFIFERTLEDLFLDSNRIIDLPRQLFHCHGLKTLNLSDNEIKTIPNAISSLDNLHWLDLSKNSIKSLPENLKNCSRLTYLNLSLNPLEKLPDVVTSILSLVELQLNDVFLDFLPANFGRLIHLKILELRENNLNTLPKSISRLIYLQRLDIGQNDFKELPEVISKLINLTELWIDMNRIRRIPPDIGQLRRLSHFDASNNNLVSLPKEIGCWVKITEFCVRSNELSEIPITISKMKNLIGLKLDDNQIQALPDSIGKLGSLEELTLTHNDLKDLPESIGLLRKLKILSVDENLLEMIPSNIGSCSSLSILSLRGNKLKSIPAEVGHLFDLKVLNLVGNQLNRLPVSLLKLQQLAALWLSDNQSQPLVPLQQEYEPEFQQLFLTCFMLPQTSQRPPVYKPDQDPVGDTSIRTGLRRICFAPESTSLEHRKMLTRAPTPYPKELRALAKHARSLQRLHSQKGNEENAGSESEMQGPRDPILVKEAIVTQRPEVSFSVTDSSEKSYYRNPTELEHQYYTDSNAAVDLLYGNSDALYNIEDPDMYNVDYSRNSSQQSVVAQEFNPVIRQAKFVRTHDVPEIDTHRVMNMSVYDDTVHYENNPYNSMEKNDDIFDNRVDSEYQNGEVFVHEAKMKDQYENNINMNDLPRTKDSRHCESYSSASDNQMLTLPLRPPPYHIAAAYSTRAHFFNNINSRSYERNWDTETLKFRTSEHDGQNIYNNTVKSNSTEQYHERDNENNDDASAEQYYEKRMSCSNDIDPDERPPMFIQDKPSAGNNIIAPTPQRPQNMSNAVYNVPFLRTPSPIDVPKYIELDMKTNSSSVNCEELYLNANNPNRQTQTSTNAPIKLEKQMKWMFGKHKNAAVKQVIIQKNPTLGFNIVEKNNGLFVDQISLDHPTSNVLKVEDKILEVESIDVKELKYNGVMEVLYNSGPSISMMISRTS